MTTKGDRDRTQNTQKYDYVVYGLPLIEILLTCVFSVTHAHVLYSRPYHQMALQDHRLMGNKIEY